MYRMDGVGPREKRPKRPEPAWLSQESNEFGTDEFMKYCEIVGAEPYMALNFGTGTLDEGQLYEQLKRRSLLIWCGNSFGLGGILQFRSRYILCESPTTEWPREAVQCEVLGARK